MNEITRLPPGVLVVGGGMAMTQTALSFQRDLSLAEVQEALPQFRYAEQGLPWWRGDFYNYFEQMFPDEYHQFMELDLTANQTIWNCQSVCRAFLPERRRQEISFSHHALLTRLSEAMQDRLLDMATQHQWTCGKLRLILKDMAANAEENEAQAHSGPQAGSDDFLPLDLPVTAEALYAVAEEHLDWEEKRTLRDGLTVLLEEDAEQEAWSDRAAQKKGVRR